MNTILCRLLYFLRRSRHDTELREEIETHRALRQAALERDGLSPHEAAQASRRAMGNVTLAVEDAREPWAGMRRWISVSEIRLGLRLIAKEPILSITVVLALATGIGLATIGFTLREAILNGQLPFPNGDRFVRLVLHSEAEDSVQLDLDAYHAIRDTSKSFAHLGAVGDADFAFEAQDGTVEAIRVNLVTPRSFQFLPAMPLIGRLLTTEDGMPGAEPVVLVRENLWSRRFGSSPSILGEPIQLSGLKRTVVGVLPDTFKFPSAGEIWVPLDEASLAGRAGPSGASLTIFGVLRDGLEKDGATAELSAYSRPERPRQPGTATSVIALPFTGDDNTTNTVMTGLVAVLVLVLLVAASNIAALVSARTWSRSSELALRTALGARRSRLVGQLLCRSGHSRRDRVGARARTCTSRAQLPGRDDRRHPVLDDLQSHAQDDGVRGGAGPSGQRRKRARAGTQGHKCQSEWDITRP